MTMRVYQMPGSTTEGVHAELYVRSLAPRGVRERQAAVLERLETLVDHGTIADYTVHVCGRELPASPAEAVTEFGTFLLNRIAVFTEWADRNGWTLDSLFETERIESRITGQKHERVEMPVMLLAEYEGRDLRFVSPCSNEATNWSVVDRLDELAAEDAQPERAEPLRRARADPPDRSAVPTQ